MTYLSDDERDGLLESLVEELLELATVPTQETVRQQNKASCHYYQMLLTLLKVMGSHYRKMYQRRLPGTGVLS